MSIAFELGHLGFVVTVVVEVAVFDDVEPLAGAGVALKNHWSHCYNV